MYQKCIECIKSVSKMYGVYQKCIKNVWSVSKVYQNCIKIVSKYQKCIKVSKVYQFWYAFDTVSFPPWVTLIMRLRQMIKVEIIFSNPPTSYVYLHCTHIVIKLHKIKFNIKYFSLQMVGADSGFDFIWGQIEKIRYYFKLIKQGQDTSNFYFF